MPSNRAESASHAERKKWARSSLSTFIGWIRDRSAAKISRGVTC
jgi:hypothetical protein